MPRRTCRVGHAARAASLIKMYVASLPACANMIGTILQITTPHCGTTAFDYVGLVQTSVQLPKVSDSRDREFDSSRSRAASEGQGLAH